MAKLLLLSRMNFRKSRGTSIGILLLILMSATLIGMALLIFTDAYPTAEREAERLNTGDGYFIIRNDLTGLDDGRIKELLEPYTKSSMIYHCMGYPVANYRFGGGTINAMILLDDSSIFDHEADRVEVVEEDTSITHDYIYLPYQFMSGGGIAEGDDYTIEYHGFRDTFKVRGFFSSINFASSNNSPVLFLVDDASFARISERDSEYADTVVTGFVLRDDVTFSQFEIRMTNDVFAVNEAAIGEGVSAQTILLSRSFMSLILAVSFLVVTLIMIIVTILMLGSSINNYVNENMNMIGSLKAIGYCSRDIRLSMVILFSSLALAGSVAGVILAYVLMPVMSDVIVGQMGMPYTVGISVISVAVPIVFDVLFVFTVTLAASAAIGRIEPIVALRNGTASHTYKKNRVRLDRSSLPLDMSLACKTLVNNMKQNVIMFIVVGLLLFTCVLGVVFYENFNRTPKLSLMATETFGGVLVTDDETETAARTYLGGRPEVSNVREIISAIFLYKEETTLVVTLFDDTSKMVNKEICYSGRIPKYDNEVAVSGKFAKEFSYRIGDEIELTYGTMSYRYIITGLIQTFNNMGKEAVMSMEGGRHLMGSDPPGAYLWFDAADRETVQDVLDTFAEEYGEHVLSTGNFFEMFEGHLTMFKNLTVLMLAVLCALTGAVIMIVLYLFIKALLIRKRREFGLMKALGYSTRSLMLQTALSFMPSVLLSIIVFSVVSYYLVNPYMSLALTVFGMMKTSFIIPVPGIVAVGIGLLVLSFAFAMINTRKIRDIEPINLLTAE